MNSNKSRDTVDYAIDLGTNDSIIAVNNYGNISIIKNYQTDKISTASAVHMDNNANIHVGSIARRNSIIDPLNATTEFKLNMGFPIKFHFQDADRDMLPEELSAQVLKNLKKSIYEYTQEDIDEVVITVPANSNPLKTKATRKAAKLAGFKKSYFILEPVAAAIAYGIKEKDDGIWMVYDLGAGTFDVCLVKKEDEQLIKLANDGIDNLGGKIFDWMIVDEYFREKIIKDLKLDDFRKDNPRYTRVFARLKYLAEDSKKKLSTQSQIKIEYSNLFDNYDFKYTLTRRQLEEIISPFIETTIDLCNRLLEDSQINADNLSKIILVGGSTLTPYIQERLKEQYNKTLEKSINPLTVVARGAAVYAGTLERKIQKADTDNISLIYNTESADEYYYNVDGRIFTAGDNLSYSQYRIRIYNNNYSVETKVESDGRFNIQLPYNDERYNIKIKNQNDNSVLLDERSPDKIYYKHRIYKNQTLYNTISLGLADESRLILAKKNDNITDQIETFVYTNKALYKQSDDYIKIPVYVGDYDKASNNILIGKIIIKTEYLIEDLPEHSQIMIKFKINNQNRIKFKVYIESQDLLLDDCFEYVKHRMTQDELTVEYKKIKEKYNNYKRYPQDNYINQQLNTIQDKKLLEYLDVLMKITNEDSNCSNSTLEYIHYINNILDKIENYLYKQNLQDNIEEKLIKLESIIQTQAQQNQYNQIKEKLIQNNKTTQEYEEILEEIIRIYISQNRELVIKKAFTHLQYEGIYTDNQQLSQQLIIKAQNALKEENYEKLLKNTIKLYKIDESTKNKSISDIKLQ